MKNWLYIGIGVAIAMIIILWPSSKDGYSQGVPAKYHAALDAAIAESGRADEILNLLNTTAEESQDEMAYLIVNMYAEDLRSMDLAHVAELFRSKNRSNKKKK